MDLQDISVSVTRAFRENGTTYPCYWEVRDSAHGVGLMAAVADSDSGQFVLPDDAHEVVTRQIVLNCLQDRGCTFTQAMRVWHRLAENGLIEP